MPRLPGRLLAIALLLAAAPAGARVVRYDCTLQVPVSQSWIPKTLRIEQDAGSGRVTVFDPVIRLLVGAPVPGVTAAETARRVAFTWELKNVTAPGTKQRVPALSYTATIRKRTLDITVTMVPSAYDNTFQATGTCRVK